jgi:hypothetical protein
MDADIKRSSDTDKDMNSLFPKAEEVKRKIGRPKKEDTSTVSQVEEVEESIPPVVYNSDSEVWKQAMFVIMENFMVKSPVDIVRCIPAADEFLRVFKERWDV